MDLVTEMSESLNAEVGNISRIRPPPIIRRGIRKKTLSLNPEEREALENLVEEVILEGGIGDSPSSDEDDGTDSDNKQQANGPNLSSKNSKTGAQGDGPKSKPDATPSRKYYPGQLKVALKHMSEIPPRFSRKLRKAERYLEMNGLPKHPTSAVIAEEDEEDIKKEHSPSGGNHVDEKRDKEKEKLKTREVQVKEAKKDIRTLLNDMNQYSDETTVGVTTEEPPITDSIVSNGQTDANSSLSNRAGPINCEDLERELLSCTNSTGSVEHYVPQSVENYSDNLGNVSFNQSMLINNLENDEIVLQFSECNYGINNQDLKNSIHYPTSFQTPSVLYSNSDEMTQALNSSSSYYVRSPGNISNNMQTSIVSAQSHYSPGSVYIQSPNYTSPTSQLDGNYINVDTQVQMLPYGTSGSNELPSNMRSYPLSQDMMMSMSMAYAVPKSSGEALMQRSAMPNVQIPPPFPFLSLGQGVHSTVSHVQGAHSTLLPPPFQGLPPSVQQMPSIQGVPSSFQGMPPNMQGIPPHMQQMPPNMHSIHGPSQIQGIAQFQGVTPSQNLQLSTSTYHQQFTVPPPSFPPPNHPLVVMPNGDMFRCPPPNLVSHSVPPYPPPQLPHAGTEATSLYACMPPALFMIPKSSGQTNSGTGSGEKAKVNGWIGSVPGGEVNHISRGLISPSGSRIRPQSGNDRFTRKINSNSSSVDGGKLVNTMIDTKPVIKTNDFKVKFGIASSSQIPTSHIDIEENKGSIVTSQRDLRGSQPFPGRVKSGVRFSEDVNNENRPVTTTSNRSPEVLLLHSGEAIPYAASNHLSDLSEVSASLSSDDPVSTVECSYSIERPGIMKSGATTFVTTDFSKSDVITNNTVSTANKSTTVSTAIISTSAITTDSISNSSIVSTAAIVKTVSESLDQLKVNCDNSTLLQQHSSTSQQQLILCNGVDCTSHYTQKVCSSGAPNLLGGLSCDCGASSCYVELRIGEELVHDLNQLFGHRVNKVSTSRVRIPVTVARQLYDSLLEADSEAP